MPKTGGVVGPARGWNGLPGGGASGDVFTPSWHYGLKKVTPSGSWEGVG